MPKSYRLIEHPSKNYTPGILEHDLVVLHYTAGNLEDSLALLDGSKGGVSAHELVSDRCPEGKTDVYQLVIPENTLWHAGVSNWQDEAVKNAKGNLTLNPKSYGVEIVNKPEDLPGGGIKFEPFLEHQIVTLIERLKEITQKYSIHPTCVVGHSDIALAIGRKSDPGPLFPWKRLAQAGIGAWYDETEVQALKTILPAEANIDLAEEALMAYGYPFSDDINERTVKLFRALEVFQMHFRPENYKGQADQETCAILFNLMCKYFPEHSVTYKIQEYIAELSNTLRSEQSTGENSLSFGMSSR